MKEKWSQGTYGYIGEREGWRKRRREGRGKEKRKRDWSRTDSPDAVCGELRAPTEVEVTNERSILL